MIFLTVVEVAILFLFSTNWRSLNRAFEEILISLFERNPQLFNFIIRFLSNLTFNYNN